MFPLFRSLVRAPKVLAIAAQRSHRCLALTPKLLDVPEGKPAHPEYPAPSRGSFPFARTMDDFRATLEEELDGTSNHNLVRYMKHYRFLSQDATLAPTEDPAFQKLAGTILIRLRHFDLDECVELVRIAGLLHLEASSALVQGIFQMLRKYISDIDCQQAAQISLAIDLLGDRSVLTDTLHSSLPLIFDNRILRELDEDNPQACFEAAKFCLQNDVSRETREFVLEKTSRLMGACPPRLAARMVANAAYGSRSSERKPDGIMSKAVRDHLVRCFRIIATHLQEFDEKSIRRLAAAYRSLPLYCDEFHNAYRRHASPENLNEIVRLNEMDATKNCLSRNSVETLRDQLLMHREEIPGIRFGFSSVCSALARLAVNTTEPDPKLRELALLLAEVPHGIDHLRKNHVSFTKYLLYMAVLDVYPERELDAFFQEEHQLLFKNLNRALASELLLLEQCLRLRFGENSPYQLLPDLKSAALTGAMAENDDEVTNALQMGLGGEQFLLRNVVTPFGTIADLAIAMRQGEYPIALSEEENPFEGLPKDCKVVAIIRVNSRQGFDERKSLKMVRSALKERFLRLQNIHPVPIYMHEWAEMAPYERIPSIMKKIKDVLETCEPYCREQSKIP
ncbi:uncharacterized protein LOC100906645 [Galendromus occidentalis]|uniref:Uncharacterized protein LOC100906645 n=1 Tax=Galendromus occidentalis TaxID=34638 RepID=A0AAJ6QRE6_9ACAR|nr:uncharacterized protein LOC100906645 [Galendromus occidentalis]